MTQFHRISYGSICHGLIRMNKRILFGAVLGLFLLTGMYYFAPGELLDRLSYKIFLTGLTEVSIACYALGRFGPGFLRNRELTEKKRLLCWRLFFGLHAALYSFCLGMAVTVLMVEMNLSPYSLALVSILLLGCVVSVSTFAFDLVIYVAFLIFLLVPCLYASFVLVPGAVPIGFTCVFSLLYFSYLGNSVHRSEVGTLAQEETIRVQAEELRESHDAITASNEMYQNTLNNIDEIFLTFDLKGICFGNIAATAESVLGLKPTGHHLADVLRLSGREREAALHWFEVITSNLSYFDTLKKNGPNEWVDPAKLLTFRIHYFPMLSQGRLKAVIMTLSNVTSKLRAQRVAEAAELRSRFVLAVSENRVLFGTFVKEMRELLEKFENGEARDLTSVRRQLHTFKGMAGLFHINALASRINDLETRIKELEPDDTSLKKLMSDSGREIHHHFVHWLESEAMTFERLRVFGVDEVTFSAAQADLVKRSFHAQPAVAQAFDDIVIRLKSQTLHGVLRAFEPYVQKTASRLVKRVRYSVPPSSEVFLLLTDDYLSVLRALVHVLNNAVDHGIEPVGERLANSKEASGTIRVSAATHGGDLLIKVEDDGRGVDVDKVKAKLHERGVDVSGLDERMVLQAVISDGLSTRQEVSEISGQGLGLSALFAEVTRNHGAVDVTSIRGKGTVFSVRLPLQKNKILLV